MASQLGHGLAEQGQETEWLDSQQPGLLSSVPPSETDNIHGPELKR